MDYKEKLRLAKEALDSGFYDRGTIEYIFPELAESEDEKIRKNLIKLFTSWKGKIKLDNDILVEDVLLWLEKQAEQKSTNKIEPKFKVGDWITFYGGELFKILKVEPEQNGILDYLLLSQNGRDSYYNKKYVDENARLWTIQDAKDGDVLSYRDGQWIFIYKGIVTEDTFKYYALLSEKGITVNDAAFSLLSSCITPATKEQRDTLEKAMNNAGYVFDFEKKELKKIEQNPAWSENDETCLIEALGCIKVAIEHAKNQAELCDYGMVMDWLKSLKDRVQPQIKQEWSEEEERHLQCAIQYTYANGFLSTADWLKSLRPQPHWKPSDEQIDVLDEVIRNPYLSTAEYNGLIALKKQLKAL